MGEADLARAGAREVVVEDLAVDLEQLGGDDAHRGGGGHAEARLHVLDRAGRGAAQRFGLVAVEHQRSRPGRGRRAGAGAGAGGAGAGAGGRAPARPVARRRGSATVGGRGLAVEVVAPVAVDRGRVVEVALVQLLGQTRVGTEIVEAGHTTMSRTGSSAVRGLSCTVEVEIHETTREIASSEC